MGMYGLLPFVLVGGGIALAVSHVWILAAILMVMAVFGFWLLAAYRR